MKQQLSLIGNLGSDPEMRYLQDGTAVTNFSLATNRRWTGPDGEREEETTWWRVSVFGRQAEACEQYLEKGRLVSVDGRIIPDRKTGSPRLYTRQDGTVGSSFEVRAFNVLFLGGSDTSAGNPPPDDTEEDEIPF